MIAKRGPMDSTILAPMMFGGGLKKPETLWPRDTRLPGRVAGR